MLYEPWPCAICSGDTKILAIKLENMTARGPAKSRCAFNESV